jgi:hypothetical protein
LPPEVKKLKGFIWREDEQPKTKEDIFIEGNSKKKTPKKKKSLQKFTIPNSKKINIKPPFSIGNK